MDPISETDDIKELAKRRGFFIPSNQIYGGTAGFYTFGPKGTALKRNIETSWRNRFTYQEGNMEIEAPTIMPEPVFEASGHLDTFDDMIIECPKCRKSIRADHLIEDNTEIEDAERFPTEKIEMLIRKHKLQCENCGEKLENVEVDDFNLMFATSIGPGDSSPGYLRPETAQGIFVEFPQWKEYARNKLPFGVTQIGKAYRNEISPRKQIVRVRELTQAELELFIDPRAAGPELRELTEVELRLYPINEQEKDSGKVLQIELGEAFDKNIIENRWIAYYLGVAKKWYEKIGIDPERLRFRQHLEDERSHYASDCWDAEAEIDGDWIEITGFAHRGCYDLKKHQKHSGEDFTVFREFDEPVETKEATVSPDMSWLGPTYGDNAGAIKEELELMAEKEPQVFRRGEDIRIEINGKKFDIPLEKVNFEVKQVEKTGEHIMPEVIEPSFGVDRILYTVIAHNLGKDQVDGEERTVLKLPAEVAPVEVAVFPLMDKDGLGEKAHEIHENLQKAGFTTIYDDSGAIGRRYRRQDEIGTPYCITVDHETLEDGTVTIRDRDSTEQERVKISELAEELSSRL